jgi:hypothetical protein
VTTLSSSHTILLLSPFLTAKPLPSFLATTQVELKDYQQKMSTFTKPSQSGLDIISHRISRQGQELQISVTRKKIKGLSPCQRK